MSLFSKDVGAFQNANFIKNTFDLSNQAQK